MLWVPVVTYLNTAGQERTSRDNKSRVEVVREGSYTTSLEGHKNVYLYSGAENTLKISRVYSTEWLCDYNMLYYPFDTQKCPLELSFNEDLETSNSVLRLVEGFEKYSGPTELTQYFVK